MIVNKVCLRCSEMIQHTTQRFSHYGIN